jgi:hypothetical protein
MSLAKEPVFQINCFSVGPSQGSPGPPSGVLFGKLEGETIEEKPWGFCFNLFYNR